MLNPEAAARAADRRLAEYFITLNEAAAAQWEHMAGMAVHEELQRLLGSTAALERRAGQALRTLLPQLID